MERAGRLLGKIRLPANAITPEERACAAWPAAVGEKIAAKTRVRGLVRDTLVVEVEDIVWQRQLTTLRGQILANLKIALGPKEVTSLDLRPMVQRRAPQSETEVRPENTETPERLGPQRATTLIEGIRDPVLGIVYRNARKKAASAAS